ncbi:MAG: spore cortex biosynthesis protein YabQ [Clostridia bacterium]|nr:spore cortex biosynthesis protein YabQ [Clostridia bacterium]
MTNSFCSEIKVLVCCIILGIASGVIFDFFRALRYGTVVKHFTIIVHDGIFYLLTAMLTFKVLLFINGAQLRFYMPVSALIGFIFYRLIISQQILLLFVNIKKLLVSVLKITFKIAVLPVVKILKWLLTPVLLLKRKILIKKDKIALTFDRFCFKIKCNVLKLFGGRKICKERKPCRKKQRPQKRV